ncbi:MAG: hypothetical protein BWX70_01486 [Verrucomicrobia bacterium ADurb.Bin070]|nr:MAG: hypothetical protein BWX70_01486 [Verrucomicrobia bacterium ADurb.Bin070]
MPGVVSGADEPALSKSETLSGESFRLVNAPEEMSVTPLAIPRETDVVSPFSVPSVREATVCDVLVMASDTPEAMVRSDAAGRVPFRPKATVPEWILVGPV